jgi:hypothetical protein
MGAKILKTYILRDGSIFSRPFTVNGAVKRAYFSGATPYNERKCGTFQTDDAGMQAAMEASPLFNNVYDLWISSVAEAPEQNQDVVNEATPDTEATPGNAENPDVVTVEVGSWAEAKIYMVEHFGMSKFTRNEPETLAEYATRFGVSFQFTGSQDSQG